MNQSFITTESFTSLNQTGKIVKIPIGTIFTYEPHILLEGVQIALYQSIYCNLLPEVIEKNPEHFNPISKNIKYKLGDLIRDSEQYEVIVHGANCFCTMGAGIAAGIAKVFPQAKQADDDTPKGEKKKMGTISYAEIDGLVVVNAYTQFGYGKTESKKTAQETAKIREWCIRKSMKALKEQFGGKRIAMPLIGSDLAGGDWKRIEKIIWQELLGENVTIIIWEQEKGVLLKKYNWISHETIKNSSVNNS